MLVQNENLHNSLVTWLEGRGRRVRAGHDNLPNYLSAMLQCGPNHTAEIKEILLGESDVLYVEHTGNRITLVGLKAWQKDDKIETDEVSTDVAQLWANMAELQHELVLERAKNVDVEAVLELSADMERQLAAMTPRLRELNAEVTQLGLQLAAPLQSDTEEVAQLKRQLAGAVSSRATLNEAFQQKCGELAEAKKSLRAFARFRALLDYPEHAIAFARFLEGSGGRIGIYDGERIRLLAAG